MSPGTEPRLICDEMLQRVGRWLRAAGYDTLIASPGTSDRELMQFAREQKRCLITRDRKLSEFRDAHRYVLLLHGNDLDSNLNEVGERLSIDWLYNPFSRCLVCNTPIEQRAHQAPRPIPTDILAASLPLSYCSHCDQYFWEGSHVRRMRHRLESLAAKSIL